MEPGLTTTNLVSGTDGADWLVFDGPAAVGPYTTDQVIVMLYAKQMDWLAGGYGPVVAGCQLARFRNWLLMVRSG